MNRTWGILAAASLVISATADAATSATTLAAPPATVGVPAVSTALPANPAATGAKIIGNVDLRPSVQMSDGLVYSEDMIEFGVQFAPGRAITYVQTFYTAEPGQEQDALKVTTSPGWIRSRVGNIAKLPGNIDVSYENRTYLPTWEFDRTRGQIASFRNYFKFNKDFSPQFSLTFMELPIFHVFSQAGSGTSANPIFENRFYLVGTWNISDKLAFYLPVMFHQTRHRDFASDTKFSNNWSFFAWINPEIYYTVSANFSVGLGYYSGNMVARDLSSLTIGDGFKNGVFQVFANVAI